MPFQLSLTHIQKIGRIARYIALAALVVIPLLHVVLFFTHGFLLANFSADSWWDLHKYYTDQGDLWVMAVATTPLIVLHMTLMYWFSRLFGLYAHGELLDTRVVHCYIWLAWLYTLIEVIKLCNPFLFFLWQESVVGAAELSIVIEPAGILFAPVLLIIVYSLKLACTIQQENKEFV